jgi:glutamyl-tRNA reductase
MSDTWNSQLILVGTNHKHAPVELREKLAIPVEELAARMKSLLHEDGAIKEVVVLSTCNRTEIYAVTSHDAKTAERLMWALSKWSNIPVTELKERTYGFVDIEAIRHLFTVTSGLDSLVVGEHQIRGQVREAAKTAIQAGTAGRFLTDLFQRAVRVADSVREESGLELEGASVSSATVSLLKKAAGNNPINSVLLVGAGKMINLAATNLAGTDGTKVLVANRTFQRAEQLAKRIGGTAIAFDRILEALETVDAVLSCTSSTSYVITKKHLDAVAKKRTAKPLILIDAAVPRDIDPAGAGIAGIELYNIDDLAPLVKETYDTLQPQLAKADEIIQKESESFFAHLRAYNANDTLKDLRKMAEEIREKELSRALRRMGQVSDREKEILDLLTRRIVNKLLYEPTARLKEHAGNGDGEAYEAVVRELFAIDQES